MDLLNLALQQHQISEARRANSESRETARTQREEIYVPRNRVDQLALAYQALFEILTDRLEISEADLVAGVQVIRDREAKAAPDRQ